MVILGVEKIGKSTFASQAPNPIFLPIKLEEGIDDLDVPAFPVINSFDSLMEALGVLADEDHDYRTVVIDSGTTLEALVWAAVCAEAEVDSIEKVGGGYGKGYTAALEKWQTLMNALDYLRSEKSMASIIIGHVKVKRFDDPERESYDQYQFDINDKVSAALFRWADFIGFCNLNIGVAKEEVGFNKTKTKATDDGDGEPYLFTKKAPAHPGGGRGIYGRIEAEIPLSFEEFENAVTEQLETEAKAKKK